MREIELKLLLDEEGERRLRRAARGLSGEAGTTARLHTVYLDTAEGALARAGIALRLRREGRRWTQTVKAARAMRAGLSEARECNVPVPGGRIDLAAIPDADLRAAIEEATGGLPVAPVYETDIRRTVWTVSADEGSGEGTAELALDRGEIRAGERSALLREAELELVSGAPGALFGIAKRLFPDGAVAFSGYSKAERAGMLAAEGRITPGPVPRTAAEVVVTPEMTAEAAARDILAECFEQVAANVQAVLASAEPEGPHQLRIGLRRLRTAFWLFREPFGGAELRRLGEEARWLGQEVGRLRDLDVALSDLIAPAAGEAPEEPGFPALAAAVAARAEAERARVRATLRGARVQAFLFDLARFVALRGWLDAADLGQTARLAEPVGAMAARRLDDVEGRAAKRARGIEGLTVEERHELRKALKRFRYAVEFFAPLYPPAEVKAVLKPLKALQELFGDLNDAAMSEALFLAPGAPGAADPVSARAAGRLIGGAGARAEAAWHEARARWKAFAGVPRPWNRRKGVGVRKGKRG